MKEHHPGKKNHRSFVRKKEVITKLTKLTALLVNLFLHKMAFTEKAGG